MLFFYLVWGADGIVDGRDLGVLQVVDTAVGGRWEAFVVDLAPAGDGQVGELLVAQFRRRQTDGKNCLAKRDTASFFTDIKKYIWNVA